MISFSKISKYSLLGGTLRFFLKLIPSHLVIPILQGPNKCFKWIKGSGINGYWIGCYEVSKQKLITDYVREGMVCYDLGAHVGYYTLMFSRLSGKSGKVFSFEPNPLNLFYLLRHLELNKIKNANVFPVGLYKKSDIIPLTLNSSQSCLNKDGMNYLNSPVFKIDDLISLKYILSPDIVKIDVEGSELEVLVGMQILLKNKPVVLFVALDNKETRKDTFYFLKNMEYRIFDLKEREIELEEISFIDEIIAKRD